MADKCVVRNEAYRRGGLNKRERHNERKNIDYMNDDICKERAGYNVHFKMCGGGYEQAFDRMVADGVISTRGLGKDPHIVDELVFDVNTEYFDRHGNGGADGGYEYAKAFYLEAYRLAAELVGGEQNILSAVMHADERNKAVSEEMGRGVYHYHLHVVYVPVVRKEIYFKKNNKNPELAGKLREIISQVSHSKKWPRLKKMDENGEPILSKNGKPVLVNSYSLLQDRFFSHMRSMGYTDIERGERGSTAQHLSDLEYKTQRESERAAAMTALADRKRRAVNALSVEAEEKERAVSALSVEAKEKERQLAALEKKTAVTKRISAVFSEIDQMGGNRTIMGNTSVSPADWKKVSALAKEALSSRPVIGDLRQQLASAKQRIAKLEEKEGSLADHLRLLNDTGDYRQAVKLFPREVNAFISNALAKGREQRAAERGQHPGAERSGGYEI